MAVLKNFIVFEGIDGSGTSTALKRLRPHFRDAVFTAEPTGLETGLLIRRILAAHIHATPQTLAYLFAADRAEHLYGKDGIVPLCRERFVFSDRYTLSSLVYQGIACGSGLPQTLNADFPAPEKLFFFEVAVETAQRRIAGRDTREIFEDDGFQRNVRAAYHEKLCFCRAQGTEVIMVDASMSEEAVEAFLLERLGRAA